MTFTIGYTNASWTLKADLVSEFFCRVLNYMDAKGFDTVVPRHPGPGVEERPPMDLSSGYVLRSLDKLPKAGAKAPWQFINNYLVDIRAIRHGKLDDGALMFSRHTAKVSAASA
jgi:monooxygenase